MAIYTCDECTQSYCGECTSAIAWDRFCSGNCQDRYETEQENTEGIQRDLEELARLKAKYE